MGFPTLEAQNELAVQRFANTLFNLQCGTETMDQVMGDIAALGSADAAFNNYYSYAFGGMTSAQVADVIATNFGIVAGQFGLDAATVTAAKAYIATQLAATPANARGAFVADLNDMWAGLAGDATFGAAATAWNAEISKALAWEGAEDTVAGTTNTVETTFYLEAKRDIISGTSGDDLFIADVVQADGPQFNSLATGDRLNGGDGDDMLVAQITEGVFGGGGNMPIQPSTQDIEDIRLEALFSNVGLEAFDLNIGSIIHDVMELGLGAIPPNADIDELLDAIDIVNDTSVYYSAKYNDLTGASKGIEKIGSYYSDADLTIMDLNTVADNGDVRLTSAMTVGMAYTGNSDHVWNESDLHVYFDEDYLLAGTDQTESDVFYWLLDEDGYDETFGTSNYRPLLNNNISGIKFNLEGVANIVQVTIGQFATEAQLKTVLTDVNDGSNLDGGVEAPDNVVDYHDAWTWELYAKALQVELNAMIAAAGTNGNPADWSNLVGLTFSVDPAYNDTTNTDTQFVPNISAIKLTDAQGRDMHAVGFTQDNAALGPFDVYGRFMDDPSTPIDLLIEVQVELEKVGRGGDGGELVIGGMNKDADNEWGDGSSTKPAGVEQFNVTVLGDETLPNSLAALKSTNNALQVVNVVSEEGFGVGEAASLQIGNSNTVGGLNIFVANYDSALKDVRLFDASGFNGDLTLYAGITDESVAKYLNLHDTNPDADPTDNDAPVGDNVLFNYIGGAGNDSINLQIDTDVVAHEDADVLIESGDGDDVVVAALMNGEHETGTLANNEQDADHNWYWNQMISASPFDPDHVNFAWVSGYVNNLQIDSGEGDDIVWTPGAGNWSIQLGEGDDVVYTDNTGGSGVRGVPAPLEMGAAPFQFSTWMYNTIDSDSMNNIPGESQSDVNDQYRLYNAKLTVSFLGHEVTVDLANYNTGRLTDLDINQAIIKAINGDANNSDLRVRSDDPGLSAVLHAYQGEANALVIESKIDGELTVDDAPTITITAPTTLNSAEIQSLSTAYGVANNLGAVLAAMNADLLVFGANADYEARQAFFPHDGPIIGNESIYHSDNVIEGNLGDDTFVLGTNDGKNNSSNDILVYNGDSNGFDCVYNFDAAGTVVTLYNEAHVLNYVQGADAVAANPGTNVPEIFTLEVTAATGLAAAGGVITFNGGSVTIPAGATLAQVVAAFIAPTVAYTDYVATAGPTASTLTFTATNASSGLDLADAHVVDFAAGIGAPTVTGVLVGTVNVQDGRVDGAVVAAPATFESFQVKFGNNEGTPDTFFDTTYTFDGEEIPVLATEEPYDIAQAVALGSYTNWNAALLAPGSDTVVFTAKVAGAMTDVTDASFVGANVEVITYEALSSMDMIDFTSYDVTDVWVDGQGAMFGGLVANEIIVWMDENPLNPGEFTMKEINVGANAAVDATDTVITAIGVIDFGYTPDFVEGQAALVNGQATGGTFWI